MKKNLLLLGERVDYTVVKSKRARSIRISIDQFDGLVVTLPQLTPLFFAERFLVQKAPWILRHLRLLRKRIPRDKITVTKKDFEAGKHDFLTYVTDRFTFFNAFYKFNYGFIRIRRQKSIWGSCTRDGNLQFNFALKSLPGPIIDYVIVHELCHLREHNHSHNFWSLVSRMIPDHKEKRKVLRAYAIHLV
jgi:predicted metal-dependent hydrolase